MTNIGVNKTDLMFRLVRETERAISLFARGTTKTSGLGDLVTLSCSEIEKAHKILTLLERLISVKDYVNVLEKSKEYYSIIPRYFSQEDRQNKTWVIDTINRVNREREIVYIYTLIRERVYLDSGLNYLIQHLPANLYSEVDKQSINNIERMLKLSRGQSRIRIKNVFNLYNYRKTNEFSEVRCLFVPLKPYMVLGAIERVSDSIFGLNFNSIFFGRGRPNKIHLYDAEKAIKKSVASWYGREPLNKTGYILICEVNKLLDSKTSRDLREKSELVLYKPTEIRVRYLVEVEKQKHLRS